jgi:uncharacterized membrane protein
VAPEQLTTAFQTTAVITISLFVTALLWWQRVEPGSPPGILGDMMSANATSKVTANVTMPRWPAWIMFATMAACTYPAITAPAPAPAAAVAESYRALGQEPGWTVEIADGRILYVGDYGEQRIEVALPDPRPTVNGLRYETDRLIVDVTYVRCNDAMSGHGYAHEVRVAVGGRELRGCGGARRTDWDV